MSDKLIRTCKQVYANYVAVCKEAGHPARDCSSLMITRKGAVGLIIDSIMDKPDAAGLQLMIELGKTKGTTFEDAVLEGDIDEDLTKAVGAKRLKAVKIQGKRNLNPGLSFEDAKNELGF